MPTLAKTELTLLKLIYQGRNTIRELAAAAGLGISQTSMLLSQLEAKGFLNKRRHGATLRVSFSTNPFVEYYKRLVNEQLQLENILAGSGLVLLSALIMPEMSKPGRDKATKAMSLQQLSKFSGLSKVTIHRTLNRGMAAGAIRKDALRYRISESMVTLKEFLNHYAIHSAGKRLEEISMTFGISKDHLNILSVCGNEFIFSSEKDSKISEEGDFHKTGLTALESDGLVFLTNYDYYHFVGNHRQLGYEDHVVDTLVIDSISSRNVLYSLLYIKKNINQFNMETFFSLGRIYGLSERLRQMAEYISIVDTGKKAMSKSTLDKSRHLPSFEEFKELCKLYGLDEK